MRGFDVMSPLTFFLSAIGPPGSLTWAYPDAQGGNGEESVLVTPSDLADRIRALALSFPEAYEDAPWGFPVFKVAANKMFAWLQVEESAVFVTVKLTPEERQIAHLLPYVQRARYVGRYGWITARISDEESLDAALEWVRESYWLKAPAHLRSAVEGETASVE